MIDVHHDRGALAVRLAGRARVLAVSCAVLALVLAVLALCGWAFDVPALYGVAPRRPPMQPTTAVCVLLGAAGVLALPYPAVARVAGAFVTVVATLVIAEYALDVNLGFEQWLFTSKLRSPFPGRVSPLTAAALVLLGLSLAFDDRPHYARGSVVFSLGAAFIALWALAAHLYGGGFVYHAPHPVIGVGLHTAIALEALAIASLLSHPERAPMRVFVAPTLGGLAARRLVVVAIGAPLVVGVVVQLARIAGLSDEPLALALLAASSVPVGVGMVIAHARGIERADARRAEVEERFRVAFEQASDFMFIASPRGVCMQASDGALASFGREIVGRPLFDLAQDDDREFVQRALLVPTAESFRAEWWLRSGAGELVPVDVHARMLSNGSWLVAARDARDRLAAEENRERAGKAERRAREQLEAIIAAADAVSNAVAALPSGDVATVLETISLQAQALTHARHAAIELVGGGLVEGPTPTAIVSGDARRPRNSLAVPIRYNGRLVGNLHLSGKTDASEFTEDDERLAYLLANRVGTAIESARLYQMEAAGRSWLQDVLDQLPDGVVVTDAKGMVTSTNRAALAFTVRPRIGTDFLGNAVVFDMRSPNGDRISGNDLALTRAIDRHEVTRNQELLLRKQDGTDVPVLASATPIWSRRGEVLGAVLVFQDVSPLKELERLREQWTSIIAHDIRQPLAVISLSAQSIARRVSLDEAARRSIKVISESCAKLERMARDLLDASRLEARNLTLARAPVDFAELVRGIVDRAGAVTRGVPIRLELHGQLPRVEVDADRMEQIFFNLLSNAAKYGDRESAIRMSVEAHDGDIDVAVVNRGPGIDPSEMGRMFTRFARTSRTSLEGVGLGLYITKGLVEAHGGRLSVESEPGQETTFRFTVPAPPQAAEGELPRERRSRSSIPA